MSLDLSEGATDVQDADDQPAHHGEQSPGESGHPQPTAGPGTSAVVLPRRLRITAALAVVIAGVYMVACAVYNLPSSTVKVRVDGADKAMMQPWFEQDWQLFAPSPATSNARLMISIRAVGAGGANLVLPAFDAQYPIEDLQKQTPFLPTKQPGATLAAQERFASYQKQLLVIQRIAGPQEQLLHAQLDKAFQPTLDGLDRLISYEAHRRYPGADIRQVQATFTSTPMTPFSARFVSPTPTEVTTQSLQSNWFPYVSGVGSP